MILADDRMTRVEMIAAIREHYELTHTAMALRLGISNQALYGWLNRSTFDAELIKAAFPEISGDWLLTGRGDMFLGGIFAPQGEPVPAPASEPAPQEDSEIRRLTDALVLEQKMHAKTQEQVDRILSILKVVSVTRKNEKLHNTCTEEIEPSQSVEE